VGRQEVLRALQVPPRLALFQRRQTSTCRDRATKGRADTDGAKCPPPAPARRSGGRFAYRLAAPMSKSSDKPKKQQKKKPQKTLKERRSEKRAAKKFGSGPFLPADN
jgi:hypothetical protein